MLKEYQTHSELNPVIWKDGELRHELHMGFMKIAEKFHEFLEINAPILDVILIGSNANYNWTKYSDIDLHVVINFMQVSDNLHMTKNYLHLKKAIWTHNFPLKYKGIDIELYAQDKNQNLHSSVGIYSVMQQKWINRPQPDLVSIDDALIQMKADPFEYEILNLKKDHPNLEKKNSRNIIENTRIASIWIGSRRRIFS
jgi:predicted nucleotidyltransferase